jgi:hypothetical protein
MDDVSDRLSTICQIPHALACERDRSLLATVADSGYAHVRSQLDQRVLAEFLTSHPQYVEQWLRYSGDKRTEGWYVRATNAAWEVGQYLKGQGYVGTMHFSSAETACAEFILRELDGATSR